MSTGAFAVFIDQPAGGGGGGALRRVVPLPPPDGSGDIKFKKVVLSLAYDDFGESGAPSSIPCTIRILKDDGSVAVVKEPIEVGRRLAITCEPDFEAASVELRPPTGFRPSVTALVEYTTP